MRQKATYNLKTIQEAFNKYLRQNKPCFSSGTKISVEETLSIIHEAKGLAVIAHPHLIKDQALVRNLLQFNFDGIEVYYASLPHRQEIRWMDVAKRKDWFMTGGSDYHGSNKKQPLGASWVDKEHFLPLYEHFISHQND